MNLGPAEWLALVSGFQDALFRRLGAAGEVTAAEESDTAAIWNDAAGAVDLAALLDKARVMYRAALADAKRAEKAKARREEIAQAKAEQRTEGVA